MKRILNLLTVLSITLCAHAQVMVDDFETNQFGWTETSSRGGIAIIKDGVMRLEPKWSEHVIASCYAPFEYNRPFTMSVQVMVDKTPTSASMRAIGSSIFGNGVSRLYISGVGLVFDYEDDGNYMLFTFCDDEAKLYRVFEGIIVSAKTEDLKLPKGKNIEFSVEVEYNLNELVFKVNGVKALSYRRRIEKDQYLLGTSGIGFVAGDHNFVSFDNLRIEQ